MHFFNCSFLWLFLLRSTFRLFDFVGHLLFFLLKFLLFHFLFILFFRLGLLSNRLSFFNWFFCNWFLDHSFSGLLSDLLLSLGLFGNWLWFRSFGLNWLIVFDNFFFEWFSLSLLDCLDFWLLRSLFWGFFLLCFSNFLLILLFLNCRFILVLLPLLAFFLKSLLAGPVEDDGDGLLSLALLDDELLISIGFFLVLLLAFEVAFTEVVADLLRVLLICFLLSPP